MAINTLVVYLQLLQRSCSALGRVLFIRVWKFALNFATSFAKTGAVVVCVAIAFHCLQPHTLSHVDIRNHQNGNVAVSTSNNGLVCCYFVVATTSPC